MPLLTTWKMKNVGLIPAREALAHSQNLTALRLYDSILDRSPATYLEKMGFSRLTKGDYVNLIDFYWWFNIWNNC